MFKKKVEIICKFAYVKPHIITINKIDYLMFDECDDINDYDILALVSNFITTYYCL
ncbi:MAG: hypothetical protein IKO49_02870 [Bacilli bacterium]|nr:hypothetical protein [Bacilli bacterium]